VSAAPKKSKSPRMPPTAARYLMRALVLLAGLALFLFLAFNGLLAYVRTPSGTAWLLRVGLGAANEAISGHIEAGATTIKGRRVTVHDAVLLDAEGTEVARVALVEADIVWTSLLLGHIEAKELRLTGPSLSVVLDEEDSNLDRTFSAKHPGPPDAGGKPAPITFIVQHLDIEEGRVLVQTPEGPPFLLQALALEGAGRYALRSRDFQVEARGNGALDKPTPGPLTLSLRGESRGSSFSADVDVRAAGASVVLDVRQGPGSPLDGHLSLDVPPYLARALLRDWPLRVPLALQADARHSGGGYLVSANAAAGRARVQLQADVDMQAASARTVRLQAQHLDVADLFGKGPATDFALTVGGQLSGDTPGAASGKLQLAIPVSRVRGATVGPVEATLSVKGGRFEVSALRAALPGVALSGSGHGTARTLEATLQLEVEDLAALGRTFHDVLPGLPPLSGHGALHVALSGHTSHPGVEAEGQFTKLEVGPVSASVLDVALKLPDVARPLDANAHLFAAVLVVEGRTLKEVHATLVTEARALELKLSTAGGVQLQLAGTADADARGLLLDTLGLGFPEESFSLRAPAAVRFDDRRLETERLELVSSGQSLALTALSTKGQVQATLEVAHLDLAKLPALLVPASAKLTGVLDARLDVHGEAQHPDAALTANLAGGGWRGLKEVGAHLEGKRTGSRLTLVGHLTALGSAADVGVDAPESALHARVHQPVSVHLKAEGVDVGRALCEVATAGLFPEGCPSASPLVQGKASFSVDVSGFADGPTVQATLAAKDVRALGYPPLEGTFSLEGSETTPLSLKAQLHALRGSLDAQASLQATTGQLLARRPSWAGWRSVPLVGSVQAQGLNLALLQDAAVLPREAEGILEVRADVSGSLLAPKGRLDATVHKLVLPPWPNGEAHLVVVAAEGVDARLTLSSAAGDNGKAHLNVGAPLQELLHGATMEVLSHAAVSLDGDLGPFALRDLPMDANRLRRDRRLLDGQFRIAFEGKGTLLSPTLTATLTVTDLGPKDGAHLQGTAHLHSANGKQAVDMKLVSTTGGTLDLSGEVGLDVSLPALRKGLQVKEAPLQAELHSVRFEPDFVASLIPWMRSISGKLQVDGKAQGTLGRPALQGSLAWTDGSVGVIGFGLYQAIQLKAQASNDSFSIEQLDAKVQGGALSLKLLGKRAAAGFDVTGTLKTQALPVVFDDQLWCVASLDVALAGTARPWALDLTRVSLDQADLQLPEARRKNLQDLSAPKDVILTRHGVPLDEERAQQALSRDPRRRGRPGAPARQEAGDFLKLALEAPNHVSVRSKDVTLELGLSKPFQVDLGERVSINGEVRILRGRGDVWGRRFDVQPGGQVRFSGAPEEALLDVTGVYSSVQSQAKVYMHFSGEVTNVKVTPSSDPPMSESEIYTLLATGRTQLAQSSLGSSSAVGGDAGASILGSWAATELKKAVGVALPIDVLSVEVGTDERVGNQTRLEAGKYLTDDIYIGYQARINADPFRYQNANAIRVEYRFLRRWSLQLEYGDANAGSLDAVWSRDY
jgi:translocation and assembly module TamB